MLNKQKIILGTLGIGLIGLTLVYIKLFPIRTDILTSLSRTYFDSEISTAFGQYEEKLSQQVVIVVEKDDANIESLISSAKVVKKYLNDSGAFLEFNKMSKIYTKLNQYYFSKRNYLLSERQI